MLSLQVDMVLGSQMALLSSSAAVLEQLAAVLPVLEVAKLTCALLDSVAASSSRDAQSPPPPQLLQAKLEAIKNLVTSGLFNDDESRNLLLLCICRHLKLHLARREELKSVTSITG